MAALDFFLSHLKNSALELKVFACNVKPEHQHVSSFNVILNRKENTSSIDLTTSATLEA